MSKHHLEVSSSLCAPILLSSTDAVPMPCGRAEITEGASPGGAGAGEQPQRSRDMPKPSCQCCSQLGDVDGAGGSEELGWGLWVRLPTPVSGLGAKHEEEFVFISIYCRWECRGGLCRGLEVLCCSSLHPLSAGRLHSAARGCPGCVRALGAVKVTRDRDTSGCGRRG